jgi:hypothetical protein
MCISSKILFWQNLVSYRGEFWLWKKGEFLGTWSNLLLSYLSIWHIWITFATTWFIFTKQILFPISKSDTILVLCVFLSLTLVLCVVINFIRVRGSNLWRFLTNGKTTLRNRGIQVDHLKGVECNPRPLGCHNVEVGKCYTWPNHGIKSPCLLCRFSVWLVSSLEFSL